MSKQIEIINGGMARNPRLKYVLDFLSTHPLAPLNVSFNISGSNTASADIVVGYGKVENETHDFVIPCASIFFDLKTIQDPTKFGAQAYAWKGQWIYAVEAHSGQKDGKEKPFIHQKTFAFDLFETIFFHVSRYEEWFSKTPKDNYQRMQSNEMLLLKSELHRIPVVDHLVKAFYEGLGFELKSKKSTLRLTHDIDLIEKYPSIAKLFRAMARKALIEKRPLEVFSILKQYVFSKFGLSPDPYRTIDWLFIQENHLEKVVFILAGGEVKNQEGFFDVNSSKALELIERAKKSGYEIGLHPSLNTSEKPELMKAEKEKLETASSYKIERSRQHFLKFLFPDTIRHLVDTQIRIDESLGFTDGFGFRCGTGFPYHLYDFEQDQAFNLKTIPLVVMDMAWIRTIVPRFPLKKLNTEAQQHAENALNRFLKYNEFDTCISFNFHNSFFDNMLMDEQRMQSFYLNLFKQNITQD